MDWIPSLNDKITRVKSDSWFDILVYNRPGANTPEYQTERQGFFFRSKKIILTPDSHQAELLQHWFELSRIMYNKTIKFITENILDVHGSLIPEQVRQYLDISYVTKRLASHKEKLIAKTWEYKAIDASILDATISHCIYACRSRVAKIQSGMIDKFRVRMVKDYKRFKTLYLPLHLFDCLKNGFCIPILGEMKSSVPITDVDMHSILSYDKYRSKYILYVPHVIQGESITTKDLVCGVDPGTIPFLSVYSKNNAVKIATNVNFRREYKRVKKIRSELGIISRKSIKATSKIFDKINNRVKDLHYKSIKYLCFNYKCIKMGKMSTVSFAPPNIRSVEMLTYSLAPYKFRQILASQTKKYGVKLLTMSEHNTSKICSSCGVIKKVGRAKVYRCDNPECKMIADRDINAAKNIRYR